MRHIDRLPIPEILDSKQEEWQKKFEQKLAVNPKARPDSSKYGHTQIMNSLWAMSYGKCFYCEGGLSNTLREIDHQIEVAIDPSKAYDWDNLYLACPNCNDKLDHHAIPVSDALDPCRDSEETILQNLTFHGELISARNNSDKGLKTIQKYRLNTDSLNLRRLRVLQNLSMLVMHVQQQMIKEHRESIREEERNSILSFMQPDRPFSLMCKVYIEKNLQEVLSSH